MRVKCIGAGSGGLTFALLAAKHGHEVEIYEQRAGAPSGFGVVLWSDHLDTLALLDPDVVDRLVEAAQPWSGQVITVHDGAPVVVPGGGLGIARNRLLEILATRATEAGVRIHGSREVLDESDLEPYDIVVAADGAGSSVRNRHRDEFRSRVVPERNRYAWFEIDGVDPQFRFPFVRARREWMWAHVYPYRSGATTFVVETTVAAWEAEGFPKLGPAETIQRLNEIFRAHVPSTGLRPLGAAAREHITWEQFRRVTNGRWIRDRTALIGDAAHTTHFSVGSGTRYAMEDGAVLARALGTSATVEAALAQYERQRLPRMRELQRSSLRSARFFEDLPRFIERPEADFIRLLQKRRSPLVRHLPGRTFVIASRTADLLRGRAMHY